MTNEPLNSHASDSAEQQHAESEILAALESQLGLKFDGQPTLGVALELDGYCNGDVPICVEVFAHQGRTKAGQDRKLMMDMCKLLLAERLCGKPCRKIVAVCDPEALHVLKRSWRGRFAQEYGIECIVVCVTDDTRSKIRAAQQRQFR
jgi:hypothetical protein